MAFKVVQICGGLGNQMFQYAFAKSLQKHLNTPVLLDISSFDWSDRKMQLELFPIDLPYASEKEIAIAKMQHLPKLIRDTLKYMGFDRVSQEIVFEYEPELLKPSRLTYFFGYFQDPRYFDAISPLIKQTFTLPPPKMEIIKKRGRIPPQALFDFSRQKQRVCAYKKRGLCGDWLSAWH
ncbi:alpha-1,2-fucosyltransferase [Helicobacter pylori]|uniref:alpha-1,2-fucosyltransferase n=1 Tax=Helicobacter pylori TaxID=210 RepID=UPI001F2678B9|nr:alpha-1,2-fucosyltransferase [Helicobacter pylori]